MRIYGKYLPLRTALVFGGVDMDPQIKALHAGAEIVVATPGRLLDHLHQKTCNLSRVEFLEFWVWEDAKRVAREDAQKGVDHLPAKISLWAAAPESIFRIYSGK